MEREKRIMAKVLNYLIPLNSSPTTDTSGNQIAMQSNESTFIDPSQPDEMGRPTSAINLEIRRKNARSHAHEDYRINLNLDDKILSLESF